MKKKTKKSSKKLGKKIRPKLRKIAQSFSTDQVVPLSEVINFGPVTLEEFAVMGIDTLQQLEEMGFETLARKWVEYFPERLNANAFIGILATLDGVAWTKINPYRRDEAHRMVKKLRQELYLPPVKAKSRIKK